MASLKYEEARTITMLYVIDSKKLLNFNETEHGQNRSAILVTMEGLTGRCNKVLKMRGRLYYLRLNEQIH